VETLLPDLLKQYGPSFAPVGVALLVLWKVYISAERDRISAKDVLKEYSDLVDICRIAIVENTRVTERLALLIEERTRRQISNGRN
jgi:hypothetical protein